MPSEVRPSSESKKKTKRKGSSSDGARPGKRAAPAPPEPAPTVRVSFFPRDDDWSPIVATTPGLCVPSTLSFNPYKKSRASTSKRPSAQAAPELFLQSNSHPKIDFVARTEETETSESLTKHYIGVFDPSTSSLEVVEAQKVVLRGSLRSEALATTASNPSITNLSLRQDLGRTFGTKKAQKAISSLSENAITTTPTDPSVSSSSVKPDPLAAATLSSLLPGTSRTTLDAAIDASKPRPTPNLSATTPSEAYPLTTLIPPDELRLLAIKSWQDAAASSSDITGLTSRFVSSRVLRLARATLTGDGDATLLKALRYVDLLLNFHSALKPPSRNGDRRLPQAGDLRTKLGNVPDFLVDSLKQRFTAAGNPGVVSRFKYDLLLSWLCCLTLHVDGFETDTWDLKEDLRLENQEMGVYFKELGCKVGAIAEAEKKRFGLGGVAAAAVKVRRKAVLKVPLVLPVVRQRGGKKR